MVFGSLEPPPPQAHPAFAGTFSTARSQALGAGGAAHDKALGIVTLCQGYRARHLQCARRAWPLIHPVLQRPSPSFQATRHRCGSQVGGRPVTGPKFASCLLWVKIGLAVMSAA